MDLKEQILVALGLNKEEETKLGWQGKSEDGTMFVSTAEELEAGVDISVLTEDGSTILLPTGNYSTDELNFTVETEGIVKEVMRKKKEEEEEEEEEEDKKKEEMTADEAYEKAEFDHKDDEEDKDKSRYAEDFPETPAEKADWAKTYEEMKDKVKNLEDAVADIKARIGETGDKETMSEEVKEEKTELSLEELKEENIKLKEELAKTPAEAPLNTNKFSSSKAPITRGQYNKLSARDKFLHDLNR